MDSLVISLNISKQNAMIKCDSVVSRLKLYNCLLIEILGQINLEVIRETEMRALHMSPCGTKQTNGPVANKIQFSPNIVTPRLTSVFNG